MVKCEVHRYVLGAYMGYGYMWSTSLGVRCLYGIWLNVKYIVGCYMLL